MLLWSGLLDMLASVSISTKARVSMVAFQRPIAWYDICDGQGQYLAVVEKIYEGR
jgi:hypothetical protein